MKILLSLGMDSIATAHIRVIFLSSNQHHLNAKYPISVPWDQDRSLAGPVLAEPEVRLCTITSSL